MSEARLFASFPFIFNSLSGVQPASDLDTDFNAVNLGTVSIGTQILTGSQTLVASNDYSFFLCRPASNMNLTMPSSPVANWSFFVSNQSNANTVSLLGPWVIAGQSVMNPVLPGNFGSLNNVKGGLAVYDGAVFTLYPSLYGDFGGGGGGGTTITTYSLSVALGAATATITHNLNNPAAILISAFANWNSGQPYITAQGANTITVNFPNECSLATGGTLVGGVIP